MKNTNILDEIRPTLKHKCNLEMLKYLEKFQQRRVVTIDGNSFLQFVGRTKSDSMLLPLGKRRVFQLSFSPGAELLEFFHAFDGLREQEPPETGNFVPAAQIVTVTKALRPDYFPEFKDFANCPIIFEATNGDQIVRTENGKFVWCVFSEHEIVDLADSFSQLLTQYIKFRAVGDGFPFDSYGR